METRGATLCARGKGQGKNFPNWELLYTSQWPISRNIQSSTSLFLPLFIPSPKTDDSTTPYGHSSTATPHAFSTTLLTPFDDTSESLVEPPSNEQPSHKINLEPQNVPVFTTRPLSLPNPSRILTQHELGSKIPVRITSCRTLTVQEVGNATTMSIPTRITARKSQPFSTTYRNHYRPGGSNILNLKNIVIHKPNACITKSSKSHLPSFCCINARSLLPKIDELTSFLSCRQPSVVAVTESWLNSDIEDGLVSINEYNIFRKDRPSRRGGGICVYLPHGTYAKRRLDLEHENLECLWLWLRPTRLPRPLSGIAVCIVYHPHGLPVKNHHQLNEYLILTIDSLRNQHPNCGLVLLGDFNDFDISNILSSHNLKQVVKVPTRGTAILDLIITNQPNLYEPPQVLAPLGSSDHNIVTWSPNLKNTNSQERTKFVKRSIRRYPRSGVEAMGRWIATHDWFGELGTNPTVDDLTSSFSSHLTEAINRIFSPITVKCHQTDKLWITPGIKKLIKDRQKAFHNHNIPLWKSLRYKVQEEIKQRKKSFYKNNVQHLKNSDSRKWWKIINKMSGKPGTTKPFTLERDG